MAGLAELEPDKLGILDRTLMRRHETSVGGNVERMLIARRRPKRAGSGTHHALIGPRYRRTFA